MALLSLHRTRVIKLTKQELPTRSHGRDTFVVAPVAVLVPGFGARKREYAR